MMVTVWDSIRETGEPDDIWSWEKIWAVTGPGPDRLWTGQSSTVWKAGHLLGAVGRTQGDFSQKRNGDTVQGLLMHSDLTQRWVSEERRLWV